MRIVHLDSDDLDNPLRGGQPVRTFEVNRRLAAQNDITVLTASYPGCRRRVTRGRLAYQRLGFTVPGLGLSPHLSFLAVAGSVVSRLPHDLVVEEFAPPIGFSFSFRGTLRPVVTIVQWFYFTDWERRYKLPFERMMRAVARRGGQRNIIVQSEAMRGYFGRLLPEARIWTLPCGVDDALFALPHCPGREVVFLGRLDIAHKGLDLLVAAWARNHARGVDIPLRIIGEGPGRADLERRIANAGLGGHITLSGRLEGEAKREALCDCAFMVMPSRQETFGITAAEAMACAKPVLAFDIDHLNEVLRPDWAVLVPRFDVDALAEAARVLWRDGGLRATLGERACSAAQAYRWDAVARQQGLIYKEVVNSYHAG